MKLRGFQLLQNKKEDKNLPHIKHFVCDFYGDCIIFQGWLKFFKHKV